MLGNSDLTTYHTEKAYSNQVKYSRLTRKLTMYPLSLKGICNYNKYYRYINWFYLRMLTWHLLTIFVNITPQEVWTLDQIILLPTLLLIKQPAVIFIFIFNLLLLLFFKFFATLQRLRVVWWTYFAEVRSYGPSIRVI